MSRSTADIVADLRECWPHVTHCRQAADRLETLQALLTLTTPTVIADELMELRLLAIEGAPMDDYYDGLCTKCVVGDLRVVVVVDDDPEPDDET